MRNISILFAFLIFCCLSNETHADELPCQLPETCFDEAAALYKSGNITEALNKFKYIADGSAEFEDPAIIGASSFMTGHIMGQLMIDGAEPFLEQAYSAYPLIGDYALFRIGEISEKRGEYDKATDIYSRLYKSYPDSVLKKRALLKTADAYLSAGNTKKARDTYKTFMRIYTKDRSSIPEVLYGIGLSYLQEGRDSIARDYFKQLWINYPVSPISKSAKEWVLLPLTPKDTYMRGENLYEAGLYVDAIAEYKRFLSYRKGVLPIKKREAYFKIGMAYSNLRRLSEAEESLEVFLNKYPRHSKAPEALYWLGRTYLRQGKEDAFIKSSIGYLKLYKKKDRTPEVLYRLGNIYADKGDTDTAISYYDRVMKEYPGSSFASDSRWAKGWLLYKKGNFERALNVFDKILRDEDESSYIPQAFYWRAKVLEKMGDSQGMEKGVCHLCSEYGRSFYCLFSRHYYNVTCTSTHADKTAMNPQLTKEDENQENYHSTRINLFLYLGLREETLDEILWARHNINGDREKAIQIASIFSAMGEYHRALHTIRPYIPGKMSYDDYSLDARLLRLIYPTGYSDLINKYADENKVDPFLLYALIREESWFNKDAVSPAGAVGLMQLMPQTAAMIAEGSYKGRDSLFAPELNIDLGTRFFADRLKQFNGNIFLTIASYNAGPDAVSRWLKEREGLELDEFIEDIPYRETRDYVKKVFRSYMEYLRLNS